MINEDFKIIERIGKKYLTIKNKNKYKIFDSETDKKLTEYIIENSQIMIESNPYGRVEENYYRIIDDIELARNIYNGKFDKCIFFINISFESKIFDCECDFSKSLFLYPVSFKNTVFKEKVIFYKTMFYSMSDIVYTEFCKDAYFDYSEFSFSADFYEAKFRANADFRYVLFYDTAMFSSVSFDKDADFNGSKFCKDAEFSLLMTKGKLEFTFSYFEGKLNLFHSSAEILNLDKIKNSSEFEISLSSFKCENLIFSSTKILNVKDRETCLYFKEFSISKHNNILALNYYTKEMNLYYSNLKWKNNFIDKFVLWSEKSTSLYGTNPFRPFLFIFILIYSFSIILYFYIDGWHIIYNGISLVNPTSSLSKILDNMSLNLINDETIGMLSFINTIKNVLVAYLIYGLIKSFRKFSRKL